MGWFRTGNGRPNRLTNMNLGPADDRKMDAAGNDQPDAEKLDGESRVKSLRSFFIRLLVSVGLLAALFYFIVDPSELKDAIELARMHRKELALAAFFYCLCGSVIRGLRWQALVQGLGHAISARVTTELFLVGTFFNQFLPTGMGGDVVRALALSRRGIGRARAASSVLIDRAIGLLPLLMIGLLALPFADDNIDGFVRWLLAAIGVVGTIGMFALFRPRTWLRIADSLPFLSQISARPGIREFAKSFSDYDRRGLLRSAFWGTAFGIVLIASNANLGQAVGITTMSYSDWAIFVPLVALSSLFPSIGGWGIREVFYVGLLKPLGVPDASALTIGLIMGVFNLLLAALGGLLTGMGVGRKD